MSISLDDIIKIIFEKILGNFERITPVMVASAIFTGLVLFLPNNILMKMNLDELPPLWISIVGIVFLLSVTLISTITVSCVISPIISKLRKWREIEDFKKKYRAMSSRQKEIIVQVLRSEDKTITLDKNSGNTIYLVDNLFLYRPQQFATLGWDNEILLTYVPQPWLLDLYNEEPDIFE